MILPITYPFYTTMQDSLFGIMLIGFPSFVLALQPNKSIVRGKFMINILKNALPAGLTDFFALAILTYMAYLNDIPRGQVATMALIIISFVGFLMLYRLCRPLNTMRIALLAAVFLGFTLGALILGQSLFHLSRLTGQNVLRTVLFCAGSVPILFLLTLLFNKKEPKREAKKAQ